MWQRQQLLFKLGLRWPIMTLLTVVTTTRGTDEPSGVNDVDNDPIEVKYLGLPTSQLELKKPLGWEVKCLQVPTTKSSCPRFSPPWITMTWMTDNLYRQPYICYLVVFKVAISGYFVTNATDKEQASVSIAPKEDSLCHVLKTDD